MVLLIVFNKTGYNYKQAESWIQSKTLLYPNVTRGKGKGKG